MASGTKNRTPVTQHAKPEPFDTVEEVWFWFIAAQQAKNDGARITAGAGMTTRPCEPVDIINILNRLYRQRRLTMDHILVLRHYGRRNMPPDLRRVKEARAHYLWEEALDRLEPVFESKGILRGSSWVKRYDPASAPLTSVRKPARAVSRKPEQGALNFSQSPYQPEYQPEGVAAE